MMMSKIKKQAVVKPKKKVSKPRIVLEEKLTEVPDDIALLPTNSPFCLKCPNVDIRKLKDTLIFTMNTVFMVAEQLNIEGNDWEHVCTKLRKWAKAEMARKISINANTRKKREAA